MISGRKRLTLDMDPPVQRRLKTVTTIKGSISTNSWRDAPTFSGGQITYE